MRNNILDEIEIFYAIVELDVFFTRIDILQYSLQTERKKIS